MKVKKGKLEGKMNNQGVMMIKMVLFLVGSLIVGALVIFAFSSIVGKLMNNAEEQIAAKDIGLTIMTLSASPNPVVYRYDKNTENYEVRITGDEVQVTSREGYGKYKYMNMIGVVVQDAVIKNALLIPMTLKDGKVSFEDEKISYSDACSNIPSTFDEEKIKVRIQIPSEESMVSAQKLEEIKLIMSMYATNANSKVEFVSSGEDLLLILRTGSSSQISYYENSADQTFAWYSRVACYISNGINSDEKIKTAFGTSILSPSSEESITINLGDTTKFIDELTKDTQLSSILANGIYSAIGLGIAS